MHESAIGGHDQWLPRCRSNIGIGNAISVICVTKSRTGNYDFRACARAGGFPGSTVFGRTHRGLRFAVCAERSRDNNLRFLRQFHPDQIWNTLITITYLHRKFKFHLKVKHRFLAVLYSKNIPSFPFRRCVYYSKCPTDKWRASVNSL